MPIISFNITQNMKNFLKKMVGSREYKNSSNVMRDALVRLMDVHDEQDALGVATSENLAEFSPVLPKITSSILITIKKYNSKLEKKLNHLETRFSTTILHKSIFSHTDIKSVMYVVEDTMAEIQSFVTDLNGLEDVLSFRYVINEPEE